MVETLDDRWRRPFRMVHHNLRTIDARGLDVARLMEETAEYGADLVVPNAAGIVSWYPTALPYQTVNPHLEGDFLGETVREGHRRGMEVWARIDLSKAVERVYERWPDWFRVDGDGRPLRSWGMVQTCFNRPYWQEKNFEILDEILSRYDVDGFFYNWFRYLWCFCWECHAAFQEATGRELPSGALWDQARRSVTVTRMYDGLLQPATDDLELWRAFVRFRYEALGAYARRVADFIHARKPEATLSLHHDLTSDFPEGIREGGWDGRLLADAADVITVESFNRLARPQPKFAYWAGEHARLGRSLKPERPTCVFLTYSEIFASRRTAQPPAQLALDLLQVAAHGGSPAVGLSGTFDQDDRKALPALKTVFRHLAVHADEYADLRPVAEVALVYSQATLDCYGRDDPMGRCGREYRGFYEALTEAHLPFDPIHEAALSEQLLAEGRYRVVILPNVACLSDARAALLDRFVRNGGHVVATYETGRHDEVGRPRDGFALATIGRRPRETRRVSGGYFRVRDAELVDCFPDTSLIGADEELLLTDALAEVSQQEDLTLIRPIENNTPEFAFWAEEAETDEPGLVVSRHGDGSVTYIPWQVGRLYNLYGVPEFAELIAWAAARNLAPLPLTTDAPSAVELVAMRQGATERLLAHLLNRATGEGKPPLRPIALGPLRLRSGRPLARARSLVRGDDLPVAAEGTGSVVTLPGLDLFDAIVLEFRPPSGVG